MQKCEINYGVNVNQFKFRIFDAEIKRVGYKVSKCESVKVEMSKMSSSEGREKRLRE